MKRIYFEHYFFVSYPLCGSGLQMILWSDFSCRMLMKLTLNLKVRICGDEARPPVNLHTLGMIIWPVSPSTSVSEPASQNEGIARISKAPYGLNVMD